VSARARRSLATLLASYALDAGILAEHAAAGKDHLLVVAHDALHFCPLHLLEAGTGAIADHWTVTYLPNLSLLAPQRSGSTLPKVLGTSIALGFARGEGGFAPIPQTLREASTVAKVLHAAPLVEEQATKERVPAALEGVRRAHIASHGAMDVDAPAFQMLVIHPADDEEAGRLYAYELQNLDLRGLELITLSACETALGRIDRADNLRGIPAALFNAGAETLVGTLWEVESHASEAFFVLLYEALASGTSRRDAFRRAQQGVRQSFPQFRDWGAFYLAGAWS
jgi:CHAT domain-containing protein